MSTLFEPTSDTTYHYDRYCYVCDVEGDHSNMHEDSYTLEREYNMRNGDVLVEFWTFPMNAEPETLVDCE